MKYDFDSNFTKRISFLLATKNRAPYLKKALSNINKLVGPDDELIIIDGNSTDGTEGIIQEYIDVIDIFVSEPDKSEGHAFNKAILLSKGKYIKLLTDDDTFYPKAVEQAYQVMEKNSNVDVLLAGGTKQFIGKNKKITINLMPGTDYGKSTDDVFKYGGCGIGLLIRKSSISRIGIFNSKAVALDTDFLTQAIYNGAVVKFCRINMYHHPIEKHSGTQAKNELWKEDQIKIRNRYQYKIPIDKIVKRKLYRIYNVFPEPVKNLYRNIKPFVKSIFGIRNKAQIGRIKEEKIGNHLWDGGFS